MNRLVEILRCIILYFFFCLFCTGYNLYASSTEETSTIEIPKWSLGFNDCSISDAFDQISKVTGVKVVTNKDVDKMVLNKYYKDKTIEHVVKDMLNRENYAIILRFNDKKKLESIGIWILDWSNERGNLGSVATNNPFEASLIQRKNNTSVNGVPNNPFEANRTGRNVKNSNKNNPFKANRTGRNIKNGNKNNPFVNQEK